MDCETWDTPRSTTENLSEIILSNDPYETNPTLGFFYCNYSFTFPNRRLCAILEPSMDMEQKKILSIEDDAFLLTLISTKLDEVGFKTLTASSGSEGIEKAQKEQPHLILLDIMLPDMGGFEILEQLKNDPLTQSIPVIILSNLGGRDEIEKATRLGAASYLIKSNILPNEIAEMIESELKKVPVK